jgi:NTE family protein
MLFSDVGSPFAFVDKLDTDWIKKTLRALDAAIDRPQVGSDQRVHPWSPRWYLRNRQISPGQRRALRRSIVKPLAKLRLRLNPFTDAEQEQLINWSYAV